jgi:hypothetical protein
MEKIFKLKNFNNFVWAPQVHFKVVCSLILFPLFATGVNDTGGKFAAGVVDTSGKFATGVVDTSGRRVVVDVAVDEMVG